MTDPLVPARNLNPEEFPNADLQPVAGPDRRTTGERCVDRTIRINIVLQILIIPISIVLIVLGSTDHIAFSWIYGGISGIVVSCILIVVLLIWEAKRRKDSILKRWNSAQERSRKWGYEQWEIVMARRQDNRLPNPQDNPVPVVDESIVEERRIETRVVAERRFETPTASEQTSDSQSDDTSVESYPRARPETVTKVLTRHLLRAKSASVLERGRHEFCIPTESITTRQLQRSLNDLSTRFARPVQRFKRIRADVERSDPQTLVVPTQVQSYRMARPEVQIPGAASETGLRQPVHRQVWQWENPSVNELPRENLQPSSASEPEEARHGQSMPTELTMITPLQQAMDELATPRILSELAQPVGIPLVQRFRRVSGGGSRPDLETLDEQQLANQEQNPQIPGAIYEQEGSEDPVQRQSLTFLPLQERPIQGPCPLVSQRQVGPLQTLQPSPRPSEGQDFESTLRERRPSQESENSAEETRL